MALLFKNAVLAEENKRCDILMEDGVIQKLGSGLAANGAAVHDLDGRVVTPAFCATPTHLDKAYPYDLL